MFWLWMFVYLLVGLGVFAGGREDGASVWRAGWVAVMWPVYLLMRVGRGIA